MVSVSTSRVSRTAARVAAVGSVAALTIGLTAVGAEAVPNRCPKNEIIRAWEGGPPVRHPVCPDIDEYLSHLFYPGTTYTTALAHSYRANVVVIQLALHDRGYDLVIDGLYGEQTKSKVKKWQRKKGLTVDGKVGLKTWKSLFHLGRA